MLNPNAILLILLHFVRRCLADVRKRKTGLGERLIELAVPSLPAHLVWHSLVPVKVFVQIDFVVVVFKVFAVFGDVPIFDFCFALLNSIGNSFFEHVPEFYQFRQFILFDLLELSDCPLFCRCFRLECQFPDKNFHQILL